MIPKNDSYRADEIRILEQPSYTYQLHLEQGSIRGYVDGLAAIKQAIFKILNTERFNYEIYSWNYGIELNDLIGEPKAYVYSEIERRITEALTQDDRIKSVDAFSFTADKDKVHVSFTVHTALGDFEIEKGVRI